MKSALHYPVLILFALLNSSLLQPLSGPIDNDTSSFNPQETPLHVGSSHAAQTAAPPYDSTAPEYGYNSEHEKQRSAHHTKSEFVQPNTVKAESATWSYSKLQENCYKVFRNEGNLRIFGSVKSLVPFVKNGTFTYIRNSNDTLLSICYETNRIDKHKIYPIRRTGLVYTQVDESPRFPSAYGELNEYIAKRLIYPVEYQETAIQGTVLLQTIITDTGDVWVDKIIRSLDPLADLEAIRVVVSLPRFEAATLNGKQVYSYFIIPVRFKLE